MFSVDSRGLVVGECLTQSRQSQVGRSFCRQTLYDHVVMHRRTFCLQSSASVACLLAAPWAVAAKPLPRIRELPLAKIRFETLAGQLNSTFHAYAGDKGWVPLQLVRVEERERAPLENPKALDADFERFSLVFAGSRAHSLTQETYLFEHPRIGRFEMFIVPVLTLDSTRHKYEAVFNRPPMT